jgi:hypothetical protein
MGVSLLRSEAASSGLAAWAVAAVKASKAESNSTFFIDFLPFRSCFFVRPD